MILLGLATLAGSALFIGLRRLRGYVVPPLLEIE